MLAKVRDPEAYLLDRIVLDDGCWGWAGTVRQDNGYGSVPRSVFGTSCSHRAVYEYLCGPIPEGLEVDHLCRNRACVRPSHMEPITHRENMLRGDTIVAKLAKRTHCAKGHELTLDNIVSRPSTPNVRECKTCARERLRAWQRRHRAASS